MKTHTTTGRKCQLHKKITYVGRIKYYDDGQYLFSESTGIHRLNPIDAKNDAEKLANTMD